MQKDPLFLLIFHLFPSNSYPVGEEVEYKDANRYRTISVEKCS